MGNEKKYSPPPDIFISPGFGQADTDTHVASRANEHPPRRGACLEKEEEGRRKTQREIIRRDREEGREITASRLRVKSPFRQSRYEYMNRIF